MPNQHPQGDHGEAKLQTVWKIFFGALASLALLIFSGSVRAEMSDVEAEWGAGISAQVAKYKQYPVGYFGEGGTVRVKCTIDHSGGLKAVSVETSSGSKELDEQVIKMFHLAQPFSPAPDDLKPDSFTYSLNVTFHSRKPLDLKSHFDIKEDSSVNAKIHGICRGC